MSLSWIEEKVFHGKGIILLVRAKSKRLAQEEKDASKRQKL